MTISTSFTWEFLKFTKAEILNSWYGENWTMRNIFCNCNTLTRFYSFIDALRGSNKLSKSIKFFVFIEWDKKNHDDDQIIKKCDKIILFKLVFWFNFQI